jgi:hypothetical protein
MIRKPNETPIEEIHRIRREISDRFGGDIEAIAKDAARRQAASERPLWQPKHDEPVYGLSCQVNIRIAIRIFSCFSWQALRFQASEEFDPGGQRLARRNSNGGARRAVRVHFTSYWVGMRILPRWADSWLCQKAMPARSKTVSSGVNISGSLAKRISREKT